jgi:hypothetical protein
VLWPAASALKVIDKSLSRTLAPKWIIVVTFVLINCLAEVLVIIQDRDDIRKAVEAVGERLGLVVDRFGVREDADNEEFGTAEWIRLALQAKKISVSEART